MKINFDMDGTIADLYGVSNWLEDLLHEDVRPYVEARPLVNLQALARVLNRLIRAGYEVNIISWTSRGGSEAYNEAVRQAKIKWLRQHLASVHFSEIIIIPYGTPKEKSVKFPFGILLDDENQNRDSWIGTAYDVNKILEILETLN